MFKVFNRPLTKASIIYILLFGWLIISILPFIWTFLTSIKMPIDAFSLPPVWIFEPILDAYRTLWVDGSFVLYFTSVA